MLIFLFFYFVAGQTDYTDFTTEEIPGTAEATSVITTNSFRETLHAVLKHYDITTVTVDHTDLLPEPLRVYADRSFLWAWEFFGFFGIFRAWAWELFGFFGFCGRGIF